MQGPASALCILENGDDDSATTTTTTINILTAYNNILNDLTLRF
jgi:hypothetical protein